MGCVRHPSLDVLDIPLPTTPKSPAEQTDSCFGQSLGGGPWCRLRAQGGVGGFGCDRIRFPDSLLAFCMVLGSGLTVIGMSHFLVIGGLEHHAWKTGLQQAEELPLALVLCIQFQDCSPYPCWVKKCFFKITVGDGSWGLDHLHLLNLWSGVWGFFNDSEHFS